MDGINSGRITDMGPIMDAYAPKSDPSSGKLSKTDFEFVSKHLQNKLANKDDPLERQINNLVNAVKPAFYKNPIIPDPEGAIQLYQWEQNLRNDVKRLRAEGKDPSVLLDASNKKEFYGSTEKIQSYKPNPLDAVRRQVDLLHRSYTPNTATGAPVPAPNPEIARKPGESAADYIKRRGL
jgi:hypothetical protein